MGFFPLLPSQQPKKSKFQKNLKKHLEKSSFYKCVPKIMIRWCMVLEISSMTDRWTDGKSGTLGWVPHLKREWHTGGEDRVGENSCPKNLYLLFIICQNKVPCSSSLKKVSGSLENEVSRRVYFNNKNLIENNFLLKNSLFLLSF